MRKRNDFWVGARAALIGPAAAMREQEIRDLQAQLTAAQERIAGLERAETEWRMAWDEAQDRLQRIVEAANALADAATAVMNAKGEEEMIALDGLEESLFAYREAVGGES